MPAKRVLCLGPNPAIDRTLVVPGLRLGGVARAQHTVATCGGKAANVARAARLLGLDPVLAGPLGGLAGRLVAELAQQEGLTARWTRIDGTTRTCVVIVDPETGATTVINEPGPAVTPEEWQRLIADAVAAASKTDAVAVSGSLPAGVGPTALGALVTGLGATARPLWIDTSGAGLREALRQRPDGVKINAEEAAASLDAAATTPAVLAGRLVELGAAAAIVTDGPKEVAWASRAGGWRAVPPPVTAVNTVGCGDAFLAGVLAGVTAGWPPPETLRYATAVGAAAALGLTAASLARQDLDRLLPLVALL